jgi:hypothetical protein
VPRDANPQTVFHYLSLGAQPERVNEGGPDRWIAAGPGAF